MAIRIVARILRIPFFPVVDDGNPGQAWCLRRGILDQANELLSYGPRGRVDRRSLKDQSVHAMDMSQGELRQDLTAK
jgi:hypothetical protein